MGAAAKLKSTRIIMPGARNAPPAHSYVAKARESDVVERFDRLADSVLMTEPETAQVIGYSANTLKFWRLHGKDKGPSSVKMPGTDCVRYRVGNVRAWLTSIPE
jgi:predicted DNA-binding transcriptional regulator AlpA